MNLNPPHASRPFLLLLAASINGACAATAAATDPPPGYYNSATGTGAALKSQLHNIIDNHTVFSYGDLRSILQVTDRDPSDPDRVLLVYDRVSLDVSRINPGGDIPGWDRAATWNREHTWPRSRGVFSSGPDNSDLHQVRPSTTAVNSQRGSLNFGGAFGQPFGEVGGGFWYPGDADAGMIARQQFYVAVRYDGSDSATEDLEIAGGNTGQANRLGDLASLIDWHFAAPPDAFERGRNQIIYDDYQGNRNPFVDRPEFAWSVFVDQANDSQITIAGATPSGGGASTLDLDLGAVFVGSPAPGPRSVVLNKAGQDGAYYEVTATGAATSSVVGRQNAFRNGRTDSRSLLVGIDADTSAPGAYTGAVTIDNLDVTTQGGAGRGANDGDDTIGVSLTVLDHATPSFDPANEVLSLTHDFGQVAEGEPAAVFDFSLFNLANDPLFTSAAELLQVAAVGDADRFSASLAPFSGPASLAAGDERAASAAFATDAPGAFEVTFTYTLADIDLPGREFTNLSLTLTGEVTPAPLVGDFNLDGSVDLADYTVWRDGLGDDYTIDDYLSWRNNFGAVAAATAGSAAGAAAPEPAGLWLLLVAAAASLTERHAARLAVVRRGR